MPAVGRARRDLVVMELHRLSLSYACERDGEAEPREFRTLAVRQAQGWARHRRWFWLWKSQNSLGPPKMQVWVWQKRPSVTVAEADRDGGASTFLAKEHKNSCSKKLRPMNYIYERRRPVVHRGSRDFISKVHQIPCLLVPLTFDYMVGLVILAVATPLPTLCDP